MAHDAPDIDPADAERQRAATSRRVRAFKVAGRIEAGSPFAILNLSDQAALQRIGESPAIMRDVAAELGSALSTATAVIDRLVKRGLVRRDRDESNRRVVRLSLTDEGRCLLGRFVEEQLANSVAILARLTPQERRTYLELHEKIARH